MSTDTATFIIIIAVLILMSAYFSATETAFSSLNRTRLKTMAEKGNRRAAAALELSEQYDKLLSTILIGNNIVNIATASLGTVLFVSLYGDMGATISTIVITIVVLIFGEISPKSLAKESPEKFAIFSTPIIKLLIVVLTPLNFLFSLWRKLLSKLFKINNDRRITQDELLMLVDEVREDGSINEDEGNLLKNAIEFTDMEAQDIITHRVDLEAVPTTASKEEIAACFSESGFSRLLVYDDTIDNIVGVIHQKDFYVGTGITQKSIKDIMSVPIFVPRTVKISDLLKLLQKNKSHIAVISDEYGGTLGIVTMEDILEELVGEIWDEHDEVVEAIRKIGDGVYSVSGTADLDKTLRFFDIECISESTSVGGWIMEQFGRIPNEGDSFTYKNLVFKVTATDYRRISEIEVSIIKNDSED